VAAAMQRLSFLFAYDEIPRTWWTAMPVETATITAWVGGPVALAALGDRDSWLPHCLATLSKIMRLPVSSIQQLLLGWHCHDWQADEYARGAYSYVPAGALAASHQLTAPVQKTLFFAGEHTDVSSNWGTVHGALRSGVRAAQQVLSHG
jgi:monoamine oxidase